MSEQPAAATGGIGEYLEALPQPALLLDRTGRLLAANRPARVLLNVADATSLSLSDLASEPKVFALVSAVEHLASVDPQRGPVVEFDALGMPCATWLAVVNGGAAVLCSLEPTNAGSLLDARGEPGVPPSWDLQLFRANPTPVVLCELESGRLLDASVSYFELLGVELGTGVGESLWDQGVWQSRVDYDSLFGALRRAGTVRQLETTLLTRHRDHIECVLDAERCVVGGREVALVAVTDISVRKRVERASALLEMQIRQTQKLEAIGTLAGGIAHDFNNILGSIVARSALTLADAHDPAMVEVHVAEINIATERAKALVRRILTFSRQKPQDKASVSLEVLLREALELVRPTLPASTVFEVDVQAGLPDVFADATQIHQVIINLCTNASQALDGQVGTVSISLRPVIVDQTMVLQVPELRCGNYACLSVTDTGHGMDAGTLERVFDPFFTTKGPGQGTGLGLAVVHGVVKEHEGAIVVDSAPDIGTSFQVYFPETTERTHAVSDAPPQVVRGLDEHVLLVDDERALCRSIASLLTRIGYRVTSFTDASQALDFLRRQPHAVDILLTDLTMPKLTGLDLSRAAIALRPDLPIIVTSGYTAAWDHRLALDAGVLEFRQKPVGFAELSQSIRRAIDNSKRRVG